jgi:nucleoside-diphosphate kinase
MLAEEHYAEHKGKVFFPSLIEYIRGNIHYPNDPGKRRVIAFVYQGPEAIQKIRDIAGPTNPHVARDNKPGCIRALGTIVPIKDNEGNTISERLDNLIHASANTADAEREVKLWFRPVDIPPMMRLYAAEMCREHYYYKDNRLFTSYEPGSLLLLAPGDIVWKSDLEALQLLERGWTAPCSIQTVAAKYLINGNVDID